MGISLRIPVSAYGCAGVCPAYSERQNAMQEARVIKSVMPGRCSELLALRDFGVGIRFNEIQRAVDRVDARVSIDCLLRCSGLRGLPASDPPASVRAEYSYLDRGTERTFFTPTARTSGKRFKLPKLA
jgi:hypothetical protein